MGVRKRRAKKSARTRRWLARLAIAVIVFFALSIALTLPLRWFDPSTTAFMLRDDSGRDPLLHEWQDWERLGSAAALAVVAAEDQRFGEPSAYVRERQAWILGQMQRLRRESWLTRLD